MKNLKYIDNDTSYYEMKYGSEPEEGISEEQNAFFQWLTDGKTDNANDLLFQFVG